MKGNWKTTLAGIGAIAGAIAGAIKLYLANNYPEALTVLIGGLSTGFGLIFAKDATKPT